MQEDQMAQRADSRSRERHPFLPEESETPSAGSVGAGRKILVVDDNPIVVRALEMKLKSSGFKVITAADGSEGLRAARSDKPDLIVLDINFRPSENFSSLNWDGVNIMQWLRKTQQVAQIPVVILTMEDPSRYREATVAVGAAAFFQKPVDYKEFLAAILKLLGNGSSAQQAP